jgi:uncharacterized protein YqeY
MPQPISAVVFNDFLWEIPTSNGEMDWLRSDYYRRGGNMGLQESITAELQTSIKQRDTSRTQAIRIVIGEFQRQPKKKLEDAEVINIIKKLVKSERELLAAAGQQTSEYIEVLEGYLPQQASEEEIKAWIEANIDFSALNNRMQAMKPIMAHFRSSADGNVVRQILLSIDG